jgi:GT2 family glycosyltransferase
MDGSWCYLEQEIAQKSIVKTDVIIITHNRYNELLNSVQNVLQFEDKINELILVDNGSKSDIWPSIYGLRTLSKKVKCISSERNLGVAGGRNLGISESKGDVLIFIDDDAQFISDNPIRKIVDKFSKDDSIGILSFKIVDLSGNVRREEFPHINKDLCKDREFETTYFIGAGHAIRRKVFDEVGLYPDDFFYAGEELDLSFRCIEQGYKIIYFPEVVVLHRRSLGGRMINEEKWARTYRNRLIVSFKYLPMKYVIASSIVWFGKIMLLSKSFKAPFRGLYEFLRVIGKLERKILNSQVVKRISDLKGRLWF